MATENSNACHRPGHTILASTLLSINRISKLVFDKTGHATRIVVAEI